MNDATGAANESYLGIRKNRQPLSLNLEAEMAAGIESDSAPDAELETREVDIRTAGNMCGTHAGHYERLAHDGKRNERAHHPKRDRSKYDQRLHRAPKMNRQGNVDHRDRRQPTRDRIHGAQRGAERAPQHRVPPGQPLRARGR